MGTLRSDRGGGVHVFLNLMHFLAERGIKHQCTVPYTPQQNGVAERKNQISHGDGKMYGQKSEFTTWFFWLEAVMCATYVLNRCPTKAL